MATEHVARGTVAEVFPPGEFIREELEARAWTQEQLADVLGRPLQSVNQIINGKKEITPETALALGEALGTSAELWLNLESAYRLSRSRAADPDVGRRARLNALVPVRKLIGLGWIEGPDDLDELEAEVCRFLEIDSIDTEPDLAMAARRGDGYGELTPAQMAWSFRAKHVASTMQAPRFNARRLETKVKELPQRSCRAEDVRELEQDLKRLGVRFVVVPRLSGAKIDGAAFWLGPSAPVVAIALRFDRIDSFWFTLMHELAHIHQGHAKVGYLDTNLVDASREQASRKPHYERRADDLASQWLIPEDQLQEFIASTKPYYSAAKVRALAAHVGVHPGVVAGRLHFLEELPYRNLRGMLVKVSLHL
jgi:HTH-type transcriptional regulator / antitoxin HigA